MNLRHSWRHLTATQVATRRRFNPGALDQIESAIGSVEARHAGELRFAVETAFALPDLWHGLTARERALHVFAQLGVWDTEYNAGVLIYVLMADRDVEIVADRGIAARVTHAEWLDVCEEMQGHYTAGRFAEGSVQGVHRVGELLARHFPNDGGDKNELPDRPVLL